MTIRFACPNCKQRLNAGEHRAGKTSNCPRCKQTVQIPAADAPLPLPDPATSQRHSEPIWAAPPPPPMPHVSIDERPEIVYEVHESAAMHAAEAHEIDYDRISVPRWALYFQGGLLAAVALASFVLGIVAGNSLEGSKTAESTAPQPCEVTGVISFATPGGKTFPDDGAIVIALPHEEHPDEKAPVEGLRPDDLPEPGVRGAEMINLWRGAFVRTDLKGNYRFRLPNRGKHFLLVISHHARRSRDKAPETTAMQQMGRFFESPSDLVGEKSYSWELKSVKGDAKFNKVFE